MKRNKRSLFIPIMLIVTGGILSAQCVPDTVNCVDTDESGQFCPMDLPQAGLNVLYDEVVTIIAPGIKQTQYGEVTIHYIEIDSVKNLPPGLSYFPNADIFYPDSAYCIQLTGTPTQTGVFELAIHIGATIDFLGEPTKFPFVDDSSIVVTVVEVLGVNPNQSTAFQVFQNAPNPFSELTRLAYFTPVEERVELKVYNILGVLVHEESKLVPPGEHNFNFDGRELQSGTYIYRVASSGTYYAGKLLKFK
jgi:hypothetical protein